MDYIEEMYRQMLAAQGRAPASRPDMTVYSQKEVTPGWENNSQITNPNAVLNPLGAQMPQIQKEKLTEISGEAEKPIEYPPGYKVQVPQSEIIRNNVNNALMEQQREAKNLGKNANDIYEERELYKRDMVDALNRMKSMTDKSYEAPEIDAQIKLYHQKMMEPKESVPQRDMLTEAILTLGPALGGKMLGEAGALAAPVAFKGARDTYEAQRKQEIERIKNLKDDTEKKLKAMIDLKKSGQESFDKAQERGLNRVKAELESTKSLATMSNDDLKRTEDNLLKLNESIAKEIGSKSVDIAKMDRSKELEDKKDKRASIMAGIASKRMGIPSEGERKGAFHLGLMDQAEKNINDLVEKHGTYPSMKDKWFRTKKNIAAGMFGTTLMSDFLNNSKMIDEATRQQIEAEISFLEGIGRIQSGAAITFNEWSQFREPYFPTDGDSDEAVKTKEQARKTAIDGVKIIAGRAAPLVKKPVGVIKKDEPKMSKMSREQKIKLLQSLEGK